MWQSPQTMKTPDHSAVARLKHELQDERKKLQVLPYLLQPPARAASFLPFSKTAAHDTTAWQALTRSNQQSVDKMAEYKERYRGLRAAMGDKDSSWIWLSAPLSACQVNAMPWRQAILLISPVFHIEQAYHIADLAILPFNLKRPEQDFQFCILCILMCCIERHVLSISTVQ